MSLPRTSEKPVLLPALVVLEKKFSPASVVATTDVVEVLVSSISAAFMPPFKICYLAEDECTVEVLDSLQLAHTTRPTHLVYAEKICTVVRESRRVTQLGATPIAKNSPMAACWPSAFVVVDSKLAESRYVLENFPRRAMSQKVDDSRIGWPQLTEKAYFSL